MAAHPLKVRLKSGDNEIEVEGERSDVDQLLEKWWQDRLSTVEQGEGDKAPRRSRGNASSAKPARTPAKSPDGSDSFDPHGLANRVKEDPRFATFQSKIINVPADWYNKTAFVLWFADQPLTSGQIHRSLEALDVKGAVARISDSLARNMNHFITSQQRKVGATPAYRLTANAKSKFEDWLLGEPTANGD